MLAKELMVDGVIVTMVGWVLTVQESYVQCTTVKSAMGKANAIMRRVSVNATIIILGLRAI